MDVHTTLLIHFAQFSFTKMVSAPF